MAPPTQVAAPPKGSISVGWLCVSFLNRYSQSCSSPSTSTLHFTVQALISSDSSRPVSTPFAFSQRAPMVPMSMRHTGFSSRPSSWRISRYFSNAACTASSSTATLSSTVPNVVWRQ